MFVDKSERGVEGHYSIVRGKTCRAYQSLQEGISTSCKGGRKNTENRINTEDYTCLISSLYLGISILLVKRVFYKLYSYSVTY